MPRRCADPDPDADAGDDAAGDAEAALPDLDDVAGVVGVEPVPVGDDVVEPGADEAGGHRPDGDGVDVVGVAAPGRASGAGRASTAAITPRAIISPYMEVERPEPVGAGLGIEASAASSDGSSGPSEWR